MEYGSGVQDSTWWHRTTGRNDSPLETTELLRQRYRHYRRRQIARLFHLMPREAVRELYVEARRWATDCGVHDTRDPMATLAAFSDRLLPLPPFKLWLRDRSEHPLAHLEDEGENPGSDPTTHPRQLEDRAFGHEGRSWIAGLHVFRDGPVWRGFIRFRETGHTRQYHTTDIFGEETARLVRERFRDFDEATLGAFLRSVLP